MPHRRIWHRLHPGIVIDGKVVHAGGLPKADDIAKWLTA